jgi:hypothetical protein
LLGRIGFANFDFCFANFEFGLANWNFGLERLRFYRPLFTYLQMKKLGKEAWNICLPPKTAWQLMSCISLN